MDEKDNEIHVIWNRTKIRKTALQRWQIITDSKQKTEREILITDYSNKVSEARKEQPSDNVYKVGQTGAWYLNLSSGTFNGWSLNEFAEAQEAKKNV